MELCRSVMSRVPTLPRVCRDNSATCLAVSSKERDLNELQGCRKVETSSTGAADEKLVHDACYLMTTT